MLELAFSASDVKIKSATENSSKCFVFRDINCSPDKSVTHRIIIFASLAKGKSIIYNPLLSEDCLATLTAMKAIGVTYELKDSLLSIESPGWDFFRSPESVLDFGNSGTTARLLTGVFAATPGISVICTGDESLRKRPMDRVVKQLLQAKAQIEYLETENRLPIKIQGTELEPISSNYSKASAQVKSSLILAALNTKGTSIISLPKGSRNHTEKILEKLGATISVAEDDANEVIKVSGKFRPKPFGFSVPGDPSSAAFFACLAAITPNSSIVIKNVMANETRLGFRRILQDMGVEITTNNKSSVCTNFAEPVMDLHINAPSILKPVTITREAVPAVIDEVPILAVTAAFAEGESVFDGLEELRVKESNRLQKTLELLRSFGANTEVTGDCLIIKGPVDFMKPFVFDPDRDHRLAMAASIAATRCKEASIVKDYTCVGVSFPNFFSLLKHACRS